MAATDIPSFQSVLVTTDLSERGDRAVAYAYALPQRGGVVHLVHVIDPVFVPNPLYAHYRPGRVPTAAEHAAQVEALRARLEELIPGSAAQAGIETQLHVLEGEDVVRAICSAAERLAADAVCISSHGHGLARILLGSVAAKVIERVGRPVLVVRDDGG